MLTRTMIKSSQKNTLIWFNTNIRLIIKNAHNIIRNNNFIIDDAHYKILIHKIEFLYNDTESYWAETDGETIWLNTYKNWTPDLLYYTLIHECIHGLIKRKDGSYLSEHKEHKLMEELEPLLI